MECQIGVISGDGIGPEIVTEAKKVLDQIGKKYGHLFHYTDILMGGCSIDATGVPLTDDAIAAAKATDGIYRRKYFHIPVVSISTGASSGGRTFKTA